jgi:hypothetical protein
MQPSPGPGLCIEGTLPPKAIALARFSGTDHFKRRGKSKHLWEGGKRSYSLEHQISNDGSEIFAGMVLDLPWAFSDVPNKEGDLGIGFQVRNTPLDHGQLIIHGPYRDEAGKYHRGDDDEHCFMLVTGTMPHYRLHGWMSTKTAKIVGTYEALSPTRKTKSHNVKQSQLFPFSRFPPHPWMIIEKERVPADYWEHCPGWWNYRVLAAIERFKQRMAAGDDWIPREK